MKNYNPSLHREKVSKVRANNAVRFIQKWMELNYPLMASVTRTKILVECMIEVTEERRYISQQ